jgi:hypothetical protein
MYRTRAIYGLLGNSLVELVIQTRFLAGLAVKRNQPVSVLVVTAAPTGDTHILETLVADIELGPLPAQVPF